MTNQSLQYEQNKTRNFTNNNDYNQQGQNQHRPRREYKPKDDQQNLAVEEEQDTGIFSSIKQT